MVSGRARIGPAPALLVVIAALGIALGYLAVRAGPNVDRSSLAVSVAALAFLLVPLVALSLDNVVARLRRVTEGRPGLTAAIAAAHLGPYLLYWALAGGRPASGLALMLAYVALPTAAGLLAGTRKRLGGDLLVTLLIWLPLEFRWLAPAFPWPIEGTGRILGAVLGLDLLLFLMLVVRRFEGAGYSLVARAGDLPRAAGAFALFAAVGIPLGLMTGFLEPRDDLPRILEVILAACGIYFFTGIPEETLFRGFLQNFLERLTGRALAALLLCSVLFGIAHLNNGPVPDWRYALLATLAGLAYGWVYLKTRRISAAAVTHALVDVTWSMFF